jgi:16S rRNA (guanine527-N7)-methyltransferase
LLAALAAEPGPPTTIREPPAALDAHIADSLVALELPAVRQATQVADLGSGAGFPGLVLAVALPAAVVDLVESSRRKREVIDRLIVAAGIDNARSVRLRAEALAAGSARDIYDLVTARAVASLPVLVEYAAPLLRMDGALVAWKGARDGTAERDGDRAAEQIGLSSGEAIAVEPFPGAHSRHLHVFVKRGPTPERFPRRPGMAAKRPLV